MIKKLNSWFEIDEREYLMYILQGYEITVTERRVDWLLDGKWHRRDGPARIWSDGTLSWCLYDKYHREDGPAMIWPNGTKKWWINGMRYTEEEFNEKTKCVV